MMRDLQKIQSLVGDITEDNLKYVDSYVCGDLGVFIPSVGFCGYAVRQNHTHPSYSFVILPQPNANVVPMDIIPDEDHYTAAMIPPHAPHEEKQDGAFVRYFAVMVSARLMNAVRERYGIDTADRQDWNGFLISRDIVPLINRFMDEYECEPHDSAVLDAAAYLIVNDLVKGLYGIDEANIIHGSGIVQGAVDYIQQHFARSMTVADMAAHANVSASTFSRAFRRDTGKSPAAYLMGVRLQKAKKLIRGTGLHITEIAHSCGFNSAAHLAASFRKHFRLTPTEYRSLCSNL